MDKAYVVGVGVTEFKKPKTKNGSYPLWVKEAVGKALNDAKTDYAQIEKVFVGNVLGEPGCGQRAMQEVGLTGIPILNINANCASGSSCLYLAKEYIECGRHDCILVVGFEAMKKEDVWTKYPDREQPTYNHVRAMSKIANFDESVPIAIQVFGNVAIECMERFGITQEQLAKISAKNRRHAVNNPYAQFRKEHTVEEILNSPNVKGPLTRLQCCAISDGAAAAVIASKRFVQKHNLQTQAIEILGMEMVSDLPSSFSTSCLSIGGYDITKEAADRLFTKANVNPIDVQVVELHDSFSCLELILYGALGLCPLGKAGEFINCGDNTYGGKYVINPSGGLTGKGHPYGATGIAQCAELCWQLRGEAGKRQVPNVNLALQHNIGMVAATIVALYKRAML